jgi:hypothetical protein
VLPQYPNLEQHKLLAQGELAEQEPELAELEEPEEVAAGVGATVAAPNVHGPATHPVPQYASVLPQ